MESTNLFWLISNVSYSVEQRPRKVRERCQRRVRTDFRSIPERIHSASRDKVGQNSLEPGLAIHWVRPCTVRASVQAMYGNDVHRPVLILRCTLALSDEAQPYSALSHPKPDDILGQAFRVLLAGIVCVGCSRCASSSGGVVGDRS